MLVTKNKDINYTKKAIGYADGFFILLIITLLRQARLQTLPQ